jgi:hypothetical protein
MESLDQTYITRLEELKSSIQASDQLAVYLDTEEVAEYLELRRAFEPHLHDLYQEVADIKPMQLIDLENRMMDDQLEGLYLPKILGFAILRGALSKEHKFIRPQEQFKNALSAIAHSSNFDVIHQRIGQSVQIGFALSSDIWITNFIESLPSKRVRDFLVSQKLPKYRELKQRAYGYDKYKRQFAEFNFHTAEFPSNVGELPVLYPELKHFLVHRILIDKPIDNLDPYIAKFASSEDMWGHWEFIYLTGLLANYFNFGTKATTEINNSINSSRKNNPESTKIYFEFLKELLLSDIPVDSDCNDRISGRLDKSIKDDFTKYYGLMDILHVKGWVHEDSVVAARDFYDQHEGLSTINECLRLTIYKFFSKIVRNLEVADYSQVIELFKIMTAYIHIFNNQHFNQATKNRTLWFIKKFTKVYIDKRGKEYQEVKKFIASTFQELGLMNAKEVTEFFKTKRKKKVVE